MTAHMTVAQMAALPRTSGVAGAWRRRGVSVQGVA